MHHFESFPIGNITEITHTYFTVSHLWSYKLHAHIFLYLSSIVMMLETFAHFGQNVKWAAFHFPWVMFGICFPVRHIDNKFETRIWIVIQSFFFSLNESLFLRRENIDIIHLKLCNTGHWIKVLFLCLRNGKWFALKCVMCFNHPLITRIT